MGALYLAGRWTMEALRAEGLQALDCFERPLPPQQIVCLKDGIAKAHYSLALFRLQPAGERETRERPDGAQFRFPKYKMFERG